MGYLAGAEYMVGREGKDKYGESMASDRGDNYTPGSDCKEIFSNSWTEIWN